MQNKNKKFLSKVEKFCQQIPDELKDLKKNTKNLNFQENNMQVLRASFPIFPLKQ